MRNRSSPALSASARRAVLALVVAPSVLVAVTMFAVYFVILPLFPALHRYYFPQSTTTYATYQVAINSALVAMGKFDLLYPTLGWLGWLPSVALGVLLARRHYAQARQRRELHRRPTAHVTAGAMRRTGFRNARRVREIPAARLQ